MIWIIGEYAERIDNADELLESFLESFPEEPAQVQLQLLTATVKLFLKKPTEGPQQMIQACCFDLFIVFEYQMLIYETCSGYPLLYHLTMGLRSLLFFTFLCFHLLILTTYHHLGRLC